MPRPKPSHLSERQRQKIAERKRKIEHGGLPWLQRLEYVCARLFDNNVPAFARAIGLESTHLGKVFKRQYGVSAQLLAQVLSHTQVSPDWLLWGKGPMMRGPENESPAALVLPHRLNSSFPVFDALRAATPPCDLMPHTPLPSTPTVITADHVDAASLIYAARSADQPVMLFIAAPAIHAGAGINVIEMLHKKYITSVATTGAGLVADIHAVERGLTHDLNYVARLAANQGIGYGEAAGRWAYSPRANKERSVLHSAYSLGVPATVHVELGEMAGHIYPDGPGAEIGAAFGAATYVDLLVFAEQARQLCQTPAGVLLIVGDAMRGLHLFLQARRALPHTECEKFHAVLIDSHVPPTFSSYVEENQGTPHKILGTFKSNVMTLLNACDGVFSGQITKTIGST